MVIPNIKVGDTVRICKKDIFAPFVKKGDVATVKDVEFDGDCIDILLSAFGWGWDQSVTISRNESVRYNTRTTFLHCSQKLVDKPKK